MAAPVLRPLTTGEVLDVSFGLYRALFFPLVIVAAICRTLPLVVSIYMQVSAKATTRDPAVLISTMLDHLPLWIAGIVLSLIASAFAVASTTSIVSAAYLGHAITANTALARAAGVIGRVITVSILTAISVAAGLLVLIVPGLIIMAGLALATVTLVLEPGTGPIAAMNRSWELTQGSRWKVFITVFVAWLFLLVPTIVVGVVAAVGTAAGIWSPLVSTVLSGVLQIFAYPFLYVVITVLYYDMRVRKEGFDLELLATATHPVG
jgi:uncharacterized membrane protein